MKALDERREPLLHQLADVFEKEYAAGSREDEAVGDFPAETRFRSLAEQIPAVVFLADLEQGTGRVSVPPQIQGALGISEQECRDPVFWYRRIHPDDKSYWSAETAKMLAEGAPLRCRFRILAQGDRTVWFQCEARLVRRRTGEPWFVHGAAVDITQLKDVEAALEQERNIASGILDAIGSLVVVLDPQMRVSRINSACERAGGFRFEDVRSRFFWDLIPEPDHAEQFRKALDQVRKGQPAAEFETGWGGAAGGLRVISWSITALRDDTGAPLCYIAAGADVTTRKKLESALLEASSREKQRIGRDLHDDLGQLLAGMAFMCEAHKKSLAERDSPEAAIAEKIGKLVNDAIRKTRELSHGLMPIPAEPNGLAKSLEKLAEETTEAVGADCSFSCPAPVPIHDAETASHLYHIAQEAIHNAVQHGRAERLQIVLSAGNGWRSLKIHDSGEGMNSTEVHSSGMGLDIMKYRAQAIGGSLKITSSEEHGTTVVCRFPAE
jgi:PAS domain S-box-containing protein